MGLHCGQGPLPAQCPWPWQHRQLPLRPLAPPPEPCFPASMSLAVGDWWQRTEQHTSRRCSQRSCVGRPWVCCGHFLVRSCGPLGLAVTNSCSHLCRQQTTTWAPSGKSTTSSAMTLTGETQPRPLRTHSVAPLLLTRSRRLLRAQGGSRGPMARALSQESEPTGTAAGLALAVAQSHQVL